MFVFENKGRILVFIKMCVLCFYIYCHGKIYLKRKLWNFNERLNQKYRKC